MAFQRSRCAREIGGGITQGILRSEAGDTYLDFLGFSRIGVGHRQCTPLRGHSEHRVSAWRGIGLQGTRRLETHGQADAEDLVFPTLPGIIGAVTTDRGLVDEDVSLRIRRIRREQRPDFLMRGIDRRHHEQRQQAQPLRRMELESGHSTGLLASN
ncbi:hypothetical protein D3C76_1206960 [compost metagenome]